MKIARNKPLRVLHIAFTMHARGTETWLMNLMRHIDRDKFQMDFVTVKGEQGVYDAELQSLGARLHQCAHPDNKFAFMDDLKALLKNHKPYDIIHAHPYTISGLAMTKAAMARVPVRITHSHTDRRKVQRDKKLSRRVYTASMKWLIARFATHKIAASQSAAHSLFGEKSTGVKVMHCGIDLKPFEGKPTLDIFKEFNIPKGKKIIAHVGGFNFEKNHEFLIKRFADVLTKEPNAHLLLVGEGPLHENIEQQIKALNITDNVTFTGSRQDVPEILKSVDTLVFPSLFEGLGLAIVEAQAAGIPCVVSDNIPTEATVVTELVKFLPLDDANEDWCDTIISALNSAKNKGALEVVKNSDFNIHQNVKELSAFYEEAYTLESKNLHND